MNEQRDHSLPFIRAIRALMQQEIYKKKLNYHREIIVIIDRMPLPGSQSSSASQPGQHTPITSLLVYFKSFYYLSTSIELVLYMIWRRGDMHIWDDSMKWKISSLSIFIFLRYDYTIQLYTRLHFINTTEHTSALPIDSSSSSQQCAMSNKTTPHQQFHNNTFSSAYFEFNRHLGLVCGVQT